MKQLFVLKKVPRIGPLTYKEDIRLGETKHVIETDEKIECKNISILIPFGRCSWKQKRVLKNNYFPIERLGAKLKWPLHFEYPFRVIRAGLFDRQWRTLEIEERSEKSVIRRLPA